jgi:putative peptidoglycan lipid II flippase
LFSRFFGFVRDIFFAKYLGTGILSDVFLTAFRLPNFFRNIFAEGAFNSAFVPIFSGILIQSDGKKRDLLKFSRNIFSILLYVLLILTLFVEIFMPQVVNVVASGFSDIPEKYNLVVILSRITFPYLIFISLVSFMSSVLNSLNKFAVVSVCPVILNLTFIFFSILSPFLNKNIAYLLSYAVLVGGFLQFVWLLIFTIRSKILLFPVYPMVDELSKTFFRNFSNGFLASGVVQINSMIDSIMAAKIAGAVSFIYYADRISQLPLALIGTAISISILPLLSKKIAAKSDDVFKIQEDALFIGLFLGLPSMVGLYFMADLAIPVLFERGAFTASASAAVIKCLKIYSFSLPAFITIKILQAVFFANGDTKTPLVTSSITMLSNIVLNMIFMKFFGFAGIVLSTALSSLLNVLALLSILIKQKRLVLSNVFCFKLVKVIYVLFFMIITLCFCEKFMTFGGDIFIFKFLKLLAMAGLSGTIYLGFSFYLKIVDYKYFCKKNL